MSGFALSIPNGTRIEIQFIADYLTYTHALPRNTKHIHSYRWPSLLSQMVFADTVKSPRCITGSVGPVNGINKDVSGARLLLITVLTYPVD